MFHMRAAIYARYSSENQRRESIEDQVAACRALAVERGYAVADEHVFADPAASGAREDRPALAVLRRAAEQKLFDVVLVDDLSRLARSTLLLLLLLEELRFEGVRVISVADGLDSDDREATLGIQVRGVFNELQLQDLSKKTLRGQMGQKARGFTVGEATYGYRSVPVGTIRPDKKGRMRPDGYRMTVEPQEAVTVLWAFNAFADGLSESAIVRQLNQEGIAGRRLRTRGWSAATVHRMLRNEKYAGRWIWNRTETRRDPRTGRRRQFPKPEEKWVVTEDEELRIVPPGLWAQVQERMAAVRTVWPGGPGRRGFHGQCRSRVAAYPAEFLSGSLSCSRCGGSIGKVSGKNCGYYGCLRAARRGCDNRLLVRRDVAEDAVAVALGRAFAGNANLDDLVRRVAEQHKAADMALSDARRLKIVQCDVQRRRLERLINFVADGHEGPALAAAVAAAEQQLGRLRAELNAVEGHEVGRRAPQAPWIREQVKAFPAFLKRHSAESALLLRTTVAGIVLEPVSSGDDHYYRAIPEGRHVGSDAGVGQLSTARMGHRPRRPDVRVGLVISSGLQDLMDARLSDAKVQTRFTQTLGKLLSVVHERRPEQAAATSPERTNPTEVAR